MPINAGTEAYTAASELHICAPAQIVRVFLPPSDTIRDPWVVYSLILESENRLYHSTVCCTDDEDELSVFQRRLKSPAIP